MWRALGDSRRAELELWRTRIGATLEAPSAEPAETAHREAHGLVADAVLQVQEGA